jgi:ABC-type multidrug transport system permease subunit
LISTICSEELTALQMAVAVVYPNALLSGVLWPVDGIGLVFLRKVVYCLPQTYVIESMHGIFARGWGMEHPQIYFGFLITFAWIFGLLALSLLVLRIRKHTG